MVEFLFLYAIVVTIGLAVSVHRLRRSSFEVEGVVQDALQDTLNQAVGQSLDYEKRIADLTAGLQNEVRKREELFTAVDAAVQETRRWRDLYFVEAMEHGNAQVAMMNEIARISKLLASKGVTVKLNRGIELALNEFREHHPVTQEQYAEAKKNIK